MVDTQGFNPQTGEWNDSLRVDFIWDNTNIGEALSMVVTSFTWSLVGGLYEQMDILPGFHSAGNIGGRPYQNATAMYQMLKAMGKDPMKMARELGSGGELPVGFTIPIRATLRRMVKLANGESLGIGMVKPSGSSPPLPSSLAIAIGSLPMAFNIWYMAVAF